MEPLTIQCVESSLGIESLDPQGKPFTVSYTDSIQSSLLRNLQRQYQLSASIDCLTPNNSLPRHKALSDLLSQLALAVSHAVQNRKPFVVLGGDHSCAMGTWKGVLQSMEDSSQFGLIWIDAHMDANNFSTTPSGNIHGMSLAALLGHGDEKLNAIYDCDQYIDSSNLILLGIHSFESEEKKLLDSKNINVEYQSPQLDIKKLLQDSYQDLSKRCKHIGISIDLDVIDPSDVCPKNICAISTPVDDGFAAEELAYAVQELPLDEKFIGLEIVEYYPERDFHGNTLNIITDLIGSIFSRQ